MGHAENKCEIRFAMEEDDGKREWSAEIRAELRRQGGRQSSRWLREEGGGRTMQTGGGRVEQPNITPPNINVGPTAAEVAANYQSENPNPNNSAIITINDTMAHMTSTTTQNQNVTTTNMARDKEFISLNIPNQNGPFTPIDTAATLKIPCQTLLSNQIPINTCPS
jgi:hypothetical protein